MGLIQEYADIFEKLDLSELSVEEEGLKLTLKKEHFQGGVTIQNSPQTIRQEDMPAVPEETENESLKKMMLTALRSRLRFWEFYILMKCP